MVKHTTYYLYSVPRTFWIFNLSEWNFFQLLCKHYVENSSTVSEKIGKSAENMLTFIWRCIDLKWRQCYEVERKQPYLSIWVIWMRCFLHGLLVLSARLGMNSCEFCQNGRAGRFHCMHWPLCASYALRWLIQWLLPSVLRRTASLAQMDVTPRILKGGVAIPHFAKAPC